MSKIRSLYQKLLRQFIEIINLNGDLFLYTQNESKSVYLPRLYTQINGAINWDWDDYEIERFINAFDKPYEGAFSFINDKKIHLTKVRLVPHSFNFHPFLVGKIVNKFENGYISVLLCNNFLMCKTSDDVKIGQTFYTPSSGLKEAKTKVVNVKDIN